MWLKESPIEPLKQSPQVWTYNSKKHFVHTTHGKPIDILSLKLNMVEDFQSKVDSISKSRIELYKGNLKEVSNCPICNKTEFKDKLKVYGAQYVQCQNCSHYFVHYIPRAETLRSFYQNNKEYQSTYADTRTTQTRLDQVARPKLEWVISQYERIYNRKPKTVLDVGAGSGHFVKVCRDAGILANGIEPSASGRKFASENLQVELIDADFLEDYAQFKRYDVITFWGVLEHVTNPTDFLRLAKESVSSKNLVLAEVPRWNCLSTEIQSIFPNSIVRHLDPLGHIQCFTDSSIATAFADNGYQIEAAFYFGMDAYELVTQLSLVNPEILGQLGQCIPQIQIRLDLAEMSDEIALCAKV